MDHATRHLSSPSPSSPFLFNHTEKSYKSSSSELLGPLLSSETEDSDVNACFSTSSTDPAAVQNYSPHHSDADHDAKFLQRDTNTDLNQTLTNEQSKDNSDDGDETLILSGFSTGDCASTSGGRVKLDLGHGSHSEKMEVDLDDEDDVDEEEDANMRSMLSSSSRSSTTTMPLLTDAHTHHSFSERISLGEYSPLSLVNDCDNALPMSPASLACGSHHSSFKSSLNNIKIDHLGVDSVVDVSVHGDDDVVGDTRSMSPSSLSHPSSHHNHANMWSSSSTAITQNPSMLTSTSTSIILSQHSHHPSQHSHHQINSLIHQLEPQGLDEPTPLLSNTSANSTLGSDLATGHSNQMLLHRPSSEPPLNSDINILGNFDLKHFDGYSTAPSTSMVKLSAPLASTCRGRKQSAGASVTLASGLDFPKSSASCSTPDRSTTNKAKNIRSRVRGAKADSANAHVNNSGTSMGPQVHSSKLHLQMNHQEKLKELQQRLFGDMTPVTSADDVKTDACVANGSESKNSKELKNYRTESEQHGSREEADSSANQEETTNSDGLKDASNKTSSRISRRRRLSRGQTTSSHSTTASLTDADNNTADRSPQKTVKAETAEPDTTTKTSDCLKLADLLSPNTNFEIARANGNLGFVLNADTVDRLNNGDSSDEDRKIQHIQLQMNPSLTVVSNNNGLIQPISIQQHRLQSSSNEGAIVGGANQLMQQLQRNSTQTVGVEGPLTSLQIKCHSLPNGETNFDINGGETKKSNHEMDGTANNNQCNGNSETTVIHTNKSPTVQGTTTIGAHQIAIQVICQDGTSLVLPVSSATSFNTAVALSTQNQAQLQAVLSNNCNNSVLVSNCQQNQRNNNNTQQIFPVVTMINTQNNASATSLNNATSNQGPVSIGSTTSGLAASSPTLAALLDSGSNRCVNSANNLDLQHGNILRKIVTTNPTVQNHAICSDLINAQDDANGTTSTQKKIKLEVGSECNGQTNIRAATFTLLDPQGLIVTNGNDIASNNSIEGNRSKNVELSSRSSAASKRTVTKLPISGQITTSDTDLIPQTHQVSLETMSNDNNNDNGKNKADNDSPASNKQTKMTSSTGNRQVDPAQPFRCEHCNSTFTRLGNFTRHKKIHTVPTRDGQRFKCDVCSKSFLQRCDLARHLHIHRGTEPHRCNICGKGYIRHSDLVTHQRFHNKEKPFGCPHCSKGFCQRGDLNRHLRSIHLQMKPILCPCCNRKFAKQETLLRHLNTAHRGGNKPLGLAGSSSQLTDNEPSSNLQVQMQANNSRLDSSVAATTSGTIEIITDESSKKTDGERKDDSNNNQIEFNESKSSIAAPVASLQAIQATLDKVQQNPEASRKIKVMVSASDGSACLGQPDMDNQATIN